MSVTAVAPAKINLSLRVGARRRDGFHQLHTLFHAVDLKERVTVSDAEGPEDTVEVTGTDAPHVPVGRANLALVAARELRLAAGLGEAERPVLIQIDKGIPVAGGLAGGSADAAAALVALNQLWGLGLNSAELSTVAAQVGSDVPFLLLGGSAIGTGRGEVLQPVPAGGQFHWVLLTSRAGLSTPTVFRRFDYMALSGNLPQRHAGAGLGEPPAIPEALIAGLEAGDPVAVGANLVNDLQPAAIDLRPGLGQMAVRAVMAGAAGAVVSGSGPTVALLARSAAHAKGMAEELVDAADGVVCTAGPAPGVIG
ncbi:MAG: 4-(cytidine 5'-diphospho)-2-C-methyl-D-erythritol kinase [Bifidobacteriaceae bacterium]|jgi:4-diphosphocytidyl-2-C-methyl-D-erythritol kinase|nr:4-(cytidine 5'-diphospho)-2-C-methyl-D-erythritol kinase [Bifidobacteriaceae bacterium]